MNSCLTIGAIVSQGWGSPVCSIHAEKNTSFPNPIQRHEKIRTIGGLSAVEMLLVEGVERLKFFRFAVLVNGCV